MQGSEPRALRPSSNPCSRNKRGAAVVRPPLSLRSPWQGASGHLEEDSCSACSRRHASSRRRMEVMSCSVWRDRRSVPSSSACHSFWSRSPKRARGAMGPRRTARRQHLRGATRHCSSRAGQGGDKCPLTTEAGCPGKDRPRRSELGVPAGALSSCHSTLWTHLEGGSRLCCNHCPAARLGTGPHLAHSPNSLARWLRLFNCVTAATGAWLGCSEPRLLCVGVGGREGLGESLRGWRLQP